MKVLTKSRQSIRVQVTPVQIPTVEWRLWTVINTHASLRTATRNLPILPSSFSEFLEEEFENPFMLSQFLDFITKDAVSNPSNLEAYTEEMAAEDDELLAGVLIDS